MDKKVELEQFLFSLGKQFENDPDTLINLTISFNHQFITNSTVENLAKFYDNTGPFKLMSESEKNRCIKENQLYTLQIETQSESGLEVKCELGGYSLNNIMPLVITQEYNTDMIDMLDKAIRTVSAQEKPISISLQKYNSINSPYENENKWSISIDFMEYNTHHHLPPLLDKAFPLFEVYNEKSKLEENVSEVNEANTKKMKI